jgi:hypothetical protein
MTPSKLIQWIRILHILTIAELPEYIRKAEKLMSVSERMDIINYLAAHPKDGDLMEGTGAFANCGGIEAVTVNQAAFASFTTSTASGCRYTC